VIFLSQPMEKQKGEYTFFASPYWPNSAFCRSPGSTCSRLFAPDIQTGKDSDMSARATLGCLLMAGLLVAAGCRRGPGRLYPPKIDAVSAGRDAMSMYDANKDGKIDGAELDQCPGLKAALARIDTSGDKTITADKIAARIKTWQDSKAGRIAVSCTVLRRGRPLPDADVAFAPEKFLGGNLQAASGRTGPDGVANIGVPTHDPDDPLGVAPGLYRVEITKAGEAIPPKYNAATVLGVEVAPDVFLLTMEQSRFDLEY